MANGSASEPLDLGRPRPAAPRAGASGCVCSAHLLAPRLSRGAQPLAAPVRPGRWRLGDFLLLALGFGAAIFVFFFRALSYFLSVPEFGPVLTYKLLGMVFVTFFSILLFSNIVTALSSFFLSRELDRLGRGAGVGAPALLRAARRDGHRLVVDVVALRPARVRRLRRRARHRPGLLHRDRARAAAVRRSSRPRSASCDHLLVNVFPARRTKDILVLLSVVRGDAVPALPPATARAAGESRRLRRLRRLPRRHATPDASFLPSTWATEILFPLLGLRDGNPLFYYGLLAHHGGGRGHGLRGGGRAPVPARLDEGAGGAPGAFHPRALWERGLGR